MSNVAFSTLAIYFLVLPGLLLQGGYCRGGLILPRYRKGTSTHPSRKHPTYPSNARGVAEDILKAIVAAAALHCVWGLIFARLGAKIDYLLVYEMMLGRASSETLALPLSNNSGWILAYFLTIIALPPFIGRWCLSIVRWAELDHRYKLFRFNDPWYYLIRGEIFNFPEFGDGNEDNLEIEAVVAIAIVGSGEDMRAYSGYVREWELSDKGELSRLILADAVWCRVQPGEGFGDPALYPSELIILEYGKIDTLSFSYVRGKRPPASDFLRPVTIESPSRLGNR